MRRQGEDGGQVLSAATAAGVVDAQADIDDGPDLQVVRFDDGQYGVVHPALVGLADIDPYGGLSERDLRPVAGIRLRRIPSQRQPLGCSRTW